MIILGINAYHGDTSAALVVDGELIAAAEEERFTRVKHQAGFPAHAIRYCLKAAGIRPEELDQIAISRNPRAHLYKKILFTLSRGPSSAWLKDRLTNVAKVRDIRRTLSEKLEVKSEKLKAEVQYVEHHRAHLASCFFVSPFEEAALLSVDGFGDFVSTMWGVGRGNTIEIHGWVEFPHSLGILYTAVTQYLGFLRYGDEYKVMGLAAYGEPVYLEEFRRILKLSRGMGFALDLSYFVHQRDGASMTWASGEPTLSDAFSAKLIERFGPRRFPGDPIEKRHQDLAASLQAMLEEAVFHLLNQLYQRTGFKRLSMAGGVALNCVANGQIFERTPFEEVYIQPAAYDGGTSLGAAYYVWHHLMGRPRSFEMRHAYWGPEFGEAKVSEELGVRSEELRKHGCMVRKIEDEGALCRWTAERIAEGRIVGWYQGRMEFGPRALGNRSIVADPRSLEVKDLLSSRIKRREPFRPFAPSILEEATREYFEESHPSPFMLMAYQVKRERRGVIPAVTHVDGTGRLQTVDRQTNPLYWRLIKAFEALTGVPVVLNTSFNEDEPIVCTPEEALNCFQRTKMDVLVMGKYMIERVKREK